MYANSLYDLGISVELRWCPAHSSIEGNERADKLAEGCRKFVQTFLARTPSDVILDVTMTLSSLEEVNRTRAVLSQITQQWLIDNENIESKRELSPLGIKDATQRKKRNWRFTSAPRNCMD
jgi:hypothetical protein